MVVLKFNRVWFNDFFSLCILFKKRLSCRKCWSNMDWSMSFGGYSKKRIYQTNCWLMDPFLPCLVEKWVVNLPMFINFYTWDICLTPPFPLFFPSHGWFSFYCKIFNRYGYGPGQGRSNQGDPIPVPSPLGWGKPVRGRLKGFCHP